MSSAPEAKGLRVKRWIPARSRERRYYRTVHELSDRVVQPFDTSVDNVVSGMKERVFFIDEAGTKRPPCLRDHVELEHIVSAVVSEVGVTNRVSGAEFIRTRSGSKRKMYERAVRSMSENNSTLDELAELQFFVKTEATQHLKKQVPRIISPRSFGFNYLLGRYTMAVEHKIFDAMATLFTGSPVVAKGLTQQRKGELIAEKLKPGWVCVGLDASRFDQTIGEQLLKLEHSVLLGCFPGDRLLRSLLSKQLHNKGRALCHDGMVYADIGAMRCSGDQNTSLGNCIISCLLARLFMEEHGIHGDILNDGDDLLMFIPAAQLSVLDRLSEWYIRWGLRMKVEDPAHIPEQVEFCQSKVVYGPDGWTLVRDWRKVLNTDCFANAKVDHFDKYLIHLRSVGLCGLSMAAGIPILQAFYQLCIRQGKTGKDVLQWKKYQYEIQTRAGYLAKAREVSAATRISFELAFGVTPTEQMAYEGMIESWTLAAQPLSIRQHLTIN